MDGSVTYGAVPIDDRRLLSIIEAEEEAALGSGTDELNGDRARGFRYFLGELPPPPAIAGRSKVVSRDVQDTVSWIIPALFKIFAGGEEVVRFNAVGPEDEEASDQETDVVNHVVTQMNDWPMILNTWEMDALTMKTGYVIGYWEDRTDVSEERYVGFSDEELAQLMSDPEVELIQHNSTVLQEAIVDPLSGFIVQPQITSHDVVMKRVKPEGKVCIRNLPPEQCLISGRLAETSVRNSDFFEFWEEVTVSELRELGYEVPDNISSDSKIDNETTQARVMYSEDQFNETRSDPAMKRVRCRWVWIKIDRDGDGLAERLFLVVVGHEILHEEVVGEVPVAAIPCYPMPHKHVGMSIPDVTMDIQDQKTATVRQLFDNMYLVNNSRHIVSDSVNLDDMLVSRPGGLVRLAQGKLPSEGHVLPLATQMFGAPAFQLLEYQDQVRENRTGTSRYFTGSDLNALNKTASGTAMLQNAASQRVEYLARIQAESGVSELFLIVHELLQKHSPKALTVKLRNKWVTVDPREWRKRTDMTVAVGLGTGDKAQQMAMISQVLMAQKEAFPLGIATPKNIYNALIELSKSAGFKTADRFWTDPETIQQAPPPDPMQDPKVQETLRQVQINSQLEVKAAKVNMDEQVLSMKEEHAREMLRLQAKGLEADATLKLSKAAEKADLDLTKREMKVTPAEVSERKADEHKQVNEQVLQKLAEVLKVAAAPKRAVRDAKGRLIGSEPIL
jgi:hypothetical protein